MIHHTAAVMILCLASMVVFACQFAVQYIVWHIERLFDGASHDSKPAWDMSMGPDLHLQLLQ